ncbi:LPS export ABC transporter periplasmic protein LptC [Plesiomonas shigelloides]|uniref:LPS export ABC transporter periplasmic protein LptC n=1 Tax=Plesiomonas shigelloides TaxID=703 RepID=UPI002246A08E|nr:LPS export ABC transporter periplasmic protein LptC [Plesiomonas shigelloides]MCX2533396.1 LPS export ABC transporter periplasmic protein LptC [Plesiomonas shigelloides]
MNIRWSLFLGAIALVLIGWLATNGGNEPTVPAPVQGDPSFWGNNMLTVVYDPTGKLHYKLVSTKVKYYAENGNTDFSQPLMTLYSAEGIPIWMVQAKDAVLTKDKMLYLKGDVEVNSLTPDSQLEKLETTQATINLTTQDITSDAKVTVYGANFTSVGLKMRGNLRNRTAELQEQVKSYYEIKKP